MLSACLEMGLKREEVRTDESPSLVRLPSQSIRLCSLAAQVTALLTVAAAVLHLGDIAFIAGVSLGAGYCCRARRVCVLMLCSTFSLLQRTVPVLQ
jgi:hypothetical protein